MTLLQNSFEGGTSGTTITATNSTVSGAAITVFNSGGGVFAWDSTEFAHGALSAKISTVNGTGTCTGELPTVTSTQYAWRGYFYTASVSGIQLRPIEVYDQASNQALMVIVQTTGVTVRASTTTAVWTSPDATAWPMSTWVRAEVLLNVSTGAASFATYNADSTTALWSQSMASGWAFNAATTSIGQAQFGQLGSGATTVWVDDVAQNDSSTTFIGPVATVQHNWFLRSGGAWVALDNPTIL